MEYIAYQEEYRENVIDLCMEYSAHSSQISTFTPERERFSQMIDLCNGYSLLMIKDNKCVGMIGGFPSINFLNNEQIWQETIIYVQSDYRKHTREFYEHFEYFVKGLGFKVLTMCAMHDEYYKLMDRFFKGIGYKPMEHHYIKRL